MKSATLSSSLCVVCRKSCAARVRLPGSSRRRRASTAWVYDFLVSASSSPHSWRARLRRWPASCSRSSSSSVQSFHTRARSSEGIHSFKRVSTSSLVKGSTGGAFPRRFRDPTECDGSCLVGLSPPACISEEALIRVPGSSDCGGLP